LLRDAVVTSGKETKTKYALQVSIVQAEIDRKTTDKAKQVKESKPLAIQTKKEYEEGA